MFGPSWGSARPARALSLRKKDHAALKSLRTVGFQPVRLIAEEAVKRKVLPGVGREKIRLPPEHHGLKP